MRLDGFKREAMGAMVNHWTRHSGDPDQSKHTYRNIRIDPSRTHLNYALMCGCDEYAAVCRAIRGIGDRAEVRPDPRANVVTSIIVTLPRRWPEARDPREFFEAAAKALAAEVGRDNVVGGFVHMDETTPHMHFTFVPLVRRGKETNDKTKPLLWTKRDERKNPAHKAGTFKLDRKGTIRYERVPLLGADGKQVTELVVAQSAMWSRERMKSYHDTVAEAISQEVGFVVSLRLSDEDWIDKLLSDVPQDKMDLAREAITHQLEKETAEARVQAEIAGKNAQEAEIRAAGARNDLKAVESSVEATSERLECLQRQVGIVEEECEALDKSSGERRRYVDSHKGEGGREAALDRELEELKALDRAAGGRGEQLERERAQVAGRVGRLEQALRVVREHAEGLAKKVGSLVRRVRLAWPRPSLGWRRHDRSVDYEQVEKQVGKREAGDGDVHGVLR